MIIRRLPSFPSWSASFRDLDEVRREMDRLFDTLGEHGYHGAGVFPPINVAETGDSIVVRAELPGFKKDDLEIKIEDNTLTLAGESVKPRDDERVSYHRREREWGAFRRSFSLPVRVEAGKVQARYADGVLTVDLPKAAEARPKQISVQAG